MKIREPSDAKSPRLRKRGLRLFRELHFEVHRARVSAQNFSRFDEDRILARYISELLPDTNHGTAVDLGAGDGVRWSNTYALFTNGWRGVGVESDSRRFTKLARAYRHYPRVFACRNLVTPCLTWNITMRSWRPGKLCAPSLPTRTRFTGAAISIAPIVKRSLRSISTWMKFTR